MPIYIINEYTVWTEDVMYRIMTDSEVMVGKVRPGTRGERESKTEPGGRGLTFPLPECPGSYFSNHNRGGGHYLTYKPSKSKIY